MTSLMTSSAYVLHILFYISVISEPIGTIRIPKWRAWLVLFRKKIVLGHDVTDDVINVIYDVITASKLENTITLLFFNRFGQSIHQNHGIEINFPAAPSSDWQTWRGPWTLKHVSKGTSGTPQRKANLTTKITQTCLNFGFNMGKDTSWISFVKLCSFLF